MEIQLGYCNDMLNKINKTFNVKTTLNGTLKGETSIMNPSFLIESSEFIDSNYCYIKEFNRYYYVNEITSFRNNLWNYTCSIDVLNSYKDDIMNLEVILSDTENNGKNNYLPSKVWKTNVKTKTEIKNFPYGLSDNGEFILITAGG